MDDQRPTKCDGPLYWLKRRSRRFWIATAALLPVFYVASFGPWCWITCWLNSDDDPFVRPPFMSIPLTRVMAGPNDFPDAAWYRRALHGYSLLGTDGSWGWWMRKGHTVYSSLGKIPTATEIEFGNPPAPTPDAPPELN